MEQDNTSSKKSGFDFKWIILILVLLVIVGYFLFLKKDPNPSEINPVTSNTEDHSGHDHSTHNHGNETHSEEANVGAVVTQRQYSKDNPYWT